MKKISSFFAIIDHYRRALIIVVMLFNVTLGLGYAYCINSTVHNAVAYDKTQATVAGESARIAELESTYMQLTSKITLDYAYAQGFNDASTKQTYIADTGVKKELSFNAR